LFGYKVRSVASVDYSLLEALVLSFSSRGGGIQALSSEGKGEINRFLGDAKTGT